MSLTGREQTESEYPVVHTRNNRYEPEWVVKHDWGIVMLVDGVKRSLPWHMVESVTEAIDE